MQHSDQPNHKSRQASSYMLMEHAIGTIEAGPEQQARLDELTERLTTDEFYTGVDSSIPSKCIDGRVGATGTAPNAAGGTESIMVADDLTFKRFSNDSTAQSYQNLLDYMINNNLPVGGHTDTHATGTSSGCGANDRLRIIYEFIAAHGATLQAVARELGVTIGNATLKRIVKNAAARQTFSDGAELLSKLQATAGSDVVDELKGDHREVVAVINTIAGSTLSRAALESEFGPKYEAFNVDVWAFREAAEVVATDDVAARDVYAAMLMYNLATAHVLCGPRMRVIVRSE